MYFDLVRMIAPKWEYAEDLGRAEGAGLTRELRGDCGVMYVQMFR
jgi:hypothetical protein